MTDFRFSGSVRRIVQLRPDGADGSLVATELYRRPDSGRKKGSALVRPIKRAVRRLAKAQETAAATYLERHDRSNTKKRDGWLVDLNNNVWRATRKGGKALALRRLIVP
jgi:hypothetical protein